MSLFGLIGTVRAACDPTVAGVDLGDCLVLSNGKLVSEVYDNPAVLVNIIVKNLFVFAGVLIFLLFLYAGFKFISSGAGGKEDAKKIFTSAVVGGIIMFSAYWIVQILQVLTGVNMGLGTP